MNAHHCTTCNEVGHTAATQEEDLKLLPCPYCGSYGDRRVIPNRRKSQLLYIHKHFNTYPKHDRRKNIGQRGDDQA